MVFFNFYAKLALGVLTRVPKSLKNVKASKEGIIKNPKLIQNRKY